MPAPDIAVIVCTFNPKQPLFEKTLNAIERLTWEEGVTGEGLIVDNNSAVSVAESDYVKDFLGRCPWMGSIREPKQGLSFARVAGVRETSAPLVVFFDDDNEPSADYLQEALRFARAYPFVTVFGAGKVRVDYPEPVSRRFRENCDPCFSATDLDHVEYFSSWMPNLVALCPYGLGQVARREVLDRYCLSVERGLLTCAGRKGGTLSAYEDIQIAWEAIKMGSAVGRTPALSLTHRIDRDRANRNYVKRLVFGNYFSWKPAYVECFPSRKEDLARKIPSAWEIFYRLLGIAFDGILHYPGRYSEIRFAAYLGTLAGMLKATGSKRHRWVDGLAAILGMK